MISQAAIQRCQAASWLQALDRDSRTRLENVISERRADAETVFFAEGQTNDRLFVLLDGTVAFHRTYAGHPPELVARVTPPGLFGVTTFFGGKPSRVEARAETAVWVLELDRTQFDALADTDPRAAAQLARAVIGDLAERFDALDRRVSEFLAHPPADARRRSEWVEFRSKFFEEAPM
jgi:CRP-like cAMP-binding protein